MLQIVNKTMLCLGTQTNFTAKTGTMEEAMVLPLQVRNCNYILFCIRLFQQILVFVEEYKVTYTPTVE